MTPILSHPTGHCISATAVFRLTFVLILAPQGAGYPASAFESSEPGRHPAAVDHLPPFITSPGETDVLLAIMTVFLIGAVLAFGVFFFWLHSLPERLVHNSTKVHFDIVAALALLSLFTHIHLFWVAALLIALVRIPMPDFTGQLGRIAGSLERMADTAPREDIESAPPAPPARVNAASHQPSESPAPRRVTHA